MPESESGQKPGSTDSRAENEGDQKTAPTDETEKKPDSPEFHALSSSNVTGYSYDSDSKELEIEFHGGRFYTYRGVSQDVADGLGTASSPGRYVDHKIRGVYPFSRGQSGGGTAGDSDNEGGRFRGGGATGSW